MAYNQKGGRQQTGPRPSTHPKELPKKYHQTYQEEEEVETIYLTHENVDYINKMV